MSDFNSFRGYLISCIARSSRHIFAILTLYFQEQRIQLMLLPPGKHQKHCNIPFPIQTQIQWMKLGPWICKTPREANTLSCWIMFYLFHRIPLALEQDEYKDNDEYWSSSKLSIKIPDFIVWNWAYQSCCQTCRKQRSRPDGFALNFVIFEPCFLSPCSLLLFIPPRGNCYLLFRGYLFSRRKNSRKFRGYLFPRMTSYSLRGYLISRNRPKFAKFAKICTRENLYP